MTLSTQQQNNINAKLAFLLKTLPQGVQECDLRGKITYSNKAHHHILAYQEGDIIGHYVWDFYKKESEKQTLKEYFYFLIKHQPKPEVYITSNLCADGQIKKLQINWDYQYDNNGELIGFISIISDISDMREIKDSLQKHQELLIEAQSIASIGHWELDPKTMKALWSQEMFNILGIEFTEDAGPELLSNHLHPEDKDRVYYALQSSFEVGKKHFLEYRIVRPSGDIRWIECKANQIIGTKGKVEKLRGVFQDITEKKCIADRLQLLANVFIYSSDGVFITDNKGIILDVNQSFTNITGFSRKEVLGQNPRILKSGMHSNDFYSSIWDEVDRNGFWLGEIWNRRKNGELFAESLNISLVRDFQDNIQNYIAVFSDITRIKKHQDHIEHLAHYDALTNLPNRSMLSMHLKSATKLAQMNSEVLAIIYLDLDGFKEVNDTYGHVIGDKLLIQLAANLKHHLRLNDILARMGGDEFVGIVSNLSHQNDCIPFLERLLKTASAPMVIENKMVQVSASIGVTFYPQTDIIEPEQLLRQADQAMYQAKKSGKNCYKFFDISQDREERLRNASVSRIQQAIDDKELVLYYQPKVNMQTGDVVGFEALIRWVHPEKDLIYPLEFLPIIEDDLVSVKIGEWVIKEALSQLNQWHTENLKLPISINISALQLQQANFISYLESQLNLYPKIDNSYLELEILETSALEDVNHISKIMMACQKLGTFFAIDDFGTGYSSLTYLKRLPVKTLKVDQTFVIDMMDNPDDLAIIEGVLGLATAFNREAVAEGVETVEQGVYLLRLGCKYAQGYAISKPMLPSDILTWLTHWKCPKIWTKTQRLPRKDMPLLYALIEKQSWLKSLAFYFDGRTTLLPENINQCRLEQWFVHNKDGVSYPKALFNKIKENHIELHQISDQIKELQDQNKELELNRALLAMKQLNLELVDSCEKLIVAIA